MTMYRGADIIVEYLAREGVPYAVGVCGHGNIGLLDALHRHQAAIKTISVHHEQAAGHIADAYYRVAGTPLATFTSCGPGSANLPMAVACAMLHSSAIFVVTGNVPTQQFNRGAFQETYRHYQADFPSVLRPYVKRAYQPTRADMLPTAVRDAFREMLSGRPGPVNLDVPLNVFVEEADVEVPDPSAWRRGLHGDAAGNPAAVAEAVALLASATRPVILAGNGVIAAGAQEELRRLAERLRAPVITSPMAKGALDERHPLALGPVGRNGTYMANQAGRSCDVLLALGTRFDDRASSAWLPGVSYEIPPTRLIHVDRDPGELGRNYPATVGIIGDARQVLGQMLALLPGAPGAGGASAARDAELAAWRAAWEEARRADRASDAVPIRPERLVLELRRALPDDAIVLADVGVHHNWLVQEFEVRRPGMLLQSWGFGGMGFAVCGVLGARLAAPTRPCVCVCGDGGFLMAPHILATAVEYDLPAVWIIWNNQGYVSIRDLQLGFFGGREIATSFAREATGDLYSPDFAALARAFGAQGLRIEKPGDLGGALEMALGSGRPTVLEVMVDRDVRPRATGGWELPPLPPARPTFVPPGARPATGRG
ncbi:MAG: acetolactate synthase [Candidatus Rokubacteria bacterium RIFCSPLOWO2_12_FULL_71_19]|nr:MAG: acetolactate synthase [Candidatus Rokubacteria bacterium RIFCSPLOWO2_12_FULL_71_19]